jgi:gas vesicle protein
MKRSNIIGGVILGAAAGVALVRFFSMSREDREDFYVHLKEATHELLDNAEQTVEKVEQYMDEIRYKGENEWIDKLYILKKMFRDFYGSEKHYLL